MYAMIRRHPPPASTPVTPAPAGRALAACLDALPGFVAYLLLEESGGGWLSVSLFETEATLVDARQMVAAWLANEPGAGADSTVVTIGEVIVQRGL